MTQPAQRTTMSYADYLAVERSSETKHEFLRGELFAMAGGTPEHSRLAANVIGDLRHAVRQRPCAVFTSDLRVRIVATDRATYPDVSVVCGRVEPAPDDEDAVTNPVLLVEILSDATEAQDRGEKFAHYRRIPSLREYLLVSQREPRLEVFRRQPGGQWSLWEAGPVERLALESIGAEIAVDEIYGGRLG
ncbi:MAG: Uma2 family endonuclease [Deltaproteobacteria bacterium]|nr:Uma2 family endonuclease [Deltaproteobacteria bacterium]